MNLSNEERNVLAHVVIDPEQWLASAIEALGEEEAGLAMTKKVARWRDDYEAARAKPGYQPRAARE